MVLWEILVVSVASASAIFFVPYNGSWISIGAAVISCVLASLASAYAIFYAPLLWAAIRLKAKGNMPPLLPGRFGIPYWGESLDYLTSWNDKLNPDVWYDRRKAKHGDVFMTHILGSPTVVMLGAQANKFILTNENRLFRNSWPKSLNVLIGKNALINSQDADHKRMRRITHSVLGVETLKKSIARFERLVVQHLDSGWRPGQVVHAHHKVKEMLLSLAADFFMGLKAGEELESFRRNFHDFSAGLLSQPLDLPWTAFAKAKQAREAMIAQFLSLIQLCRSSLDKREEAEDSFISMVLRAQEEGNGVSLSDEETADNLMGLFTGGYDTTASALSTVLRHLSLSPQVLQRLRNDCEKIRENLGGKNLTWNEIKSMEYLHNVIAEGLRIVAPINGGFKQAKVDVVYGGYTVPKGWKVHFSMRQTNNKEEYFKSPEIFDPNRFNEKHDPFSYIPFGQGNRMCPGNEFAEIEMKVFLYHLVLRYDLNLVEVDEPINMYFMPHPMHGLPIFLKPIA
ncbi:hypothetical protein SUGI_0377480 [Cryptomeria japonica]|uniref:cytochrome P450 716B1 n=1 Tax=Cryptomeria japonica TaxID=3369 RepID=UPI002408AE4F|nr:cytochrome P450 716B1 [Cryptomeria japonica]GLJ20723.1 hypothetical protein SUGI_0377480 [Cryptomeria japonica]